MKANLKSQRVDWIDLCKFIAIFYMAWGHIGMPSALDKYMSSFDMPIFFFLSGYLLCIDRYKNYKDYIVRKIKSLLIPYFLFPIIIFYFWSFAYNITQKSNPETQLRLWKGLFTYNSIITPFCAVQWFLTCLFLVEVTFYAIIKLSKSRRRTIYLVLLLFSLMGYFYSSIFYFRLVWSIDTALTAIVFYGLGYLFNSMDDNRIKSFIFNPSILKILCLLLISIISIFSNEYTNIRTLEYGNYFSFYLSSITSIIMYIMVSVYICKIKYARKSILYKYLLFVGKNTIVVLILDQFYNKLGYILRRYIPFLRVNIVLTIFVLILMIPSAFLLNKYLPFTLGRNNGRSKTKLFFYQ